MLISLYTVRDTHPLLLLNKDAPLVRIVSLYLHNRRRHTNECLLLIIKVGTSPFGHKIERVLDINLTETRQKADHLLLPSTEPGPHLSDVDVSHFSRSDTIAFECVSNLCLLFEFLI
jgi:hypothetical protein